MTLTVNASPFSPPLLKTTEATWVDIRDREGFLVMMIFFMPGGESFLISSKKDDDFKSVAENFKIPLHKPPEVTQQ